MQLSTLIVVFSCLSASVFANESSGDHWSYNGITGPAYWSNTYEKCNGTQQSPINLAQNSSEDAFSGDPTKHQLKYNWTKLENLIAEHNGHTVQVDIPVQLRDANIVWYDHIPYRLTQFHLHTPSEHRVDGRHFDAELHLVSLTQKNETLVTGIFIDAVATNGTDILDDLLKYLPQPKQKTEKPISIDLPRLLEAVDYLKERWIYIGSLTTPPCTEGVQWIASKRPLKLNVDELTALKDAIGFNARYTMPIYPEGRVRRQKVLSS
jgi:carbonic anhydrase